MDLLKRVIRNELIKGSFYIFAGSIFANLLAFFLNLFLARSLTYSDYAIFASLLSIVSLASIPSGSFTAIIVKFATDYYSKNQYGRLKFFYLSFFKFILSICLLFIIFSFIFAGVLISYLHLDNYIYSVAVGFTIAAFYLMNFHTAFLQSLLKFGFISIMNAFGGVLKLIFGIGLVILGYKALSGILAIFFMTVGMYLVAFIPIKKILKAQQKKNEVNISRKEILVFSIPTFFIVLCMTSFTASDVILTKHFFTSQSAGFYAGLTLIGRVIFYFTASIPMVMFPLLIKRHSTGVGFFNLFYLAILLVLLPSLLITAIYYIRPNLIINLFLGGRGYLSIAPYLWIYGIYITVFSVANLFANLFLSLNKTKIVYPVIIFSIAQIVLIYLFHSSFLEVIIVSLISVTILLIVLFLYFINTFRGKQSYSQLLPVLGSQNV